MKYYIFLLVVLIPLSVHAQSYRRHDSTYEGSVGNSIANILRSSGHAQYYSSLGGINKQIARRLSLENDVLEVETYFKRREINTAYRFPPRDPFTENDLEIGNRWRLPERLGNQIDNTTGRLVWPVVLRARDFMELRDEIDALFESRHERGYFAIVETIRLKILVKRLEDQLRDFVSYIPGNRTIEGVNFLNSIKYEMVF